MNSTANESLYNSKLIAFTFDDAPHFPAYGDNKTSKIMDAFLRYNGSATFFVNGGSFEYSGTALMQYALDHGFELGNHGMRHRLGDTEAEVLSEIGELEEYVQKQYNYTMKFFRPSGLDRNEALFAAAQRLNMPVIGADTFTNDWDIPNSTTEDIKATCFNGAVDGNIILMHANSKIADVIDEVLEKLYNDGFRFVGISDLFKYKKIAYNDIPKNVMIGSIGGLL